MHKGLEIYKIAIKINHLMYMDNIKLFANNEKELETWIQTIEIYCQVIGMEFGIEKCAMLIMRSGKWQTTEGIELPNQERIRTRGEKENYKYLGILETSIIKQVKMKEKRKRKSISDERKRFSNTSSVAGISSKR